MALTTASPLGDLTAFNPSLPVRILFPGFKLDKTEVVPALVCPSSSLDDNEALIKALALYSDSTFSSTSASGSAMDSCQTRHPVHLRVYRR